MPTKKKRHTCVCCKMRRIDDYMMVIRLPFTFATHWLCEDCYREQDRSIEVVVGQTSITGQIADQFL